MAVEQSLEKIEIIKGPEVEELLEGSREKHRPGLLSYYAAGHWQVLRVGISNITDYSVLLSGSADGKTEGELIRVNQPVGLSFRVDFDNYLAESVVQGIESSFLESAEGRLLVEKPSQIQKIHRRAYKRELVPGEMNVKVLFWHRGYLNGKKDVPMEHYWQAKLLDLSAGGMRLEICRELKDCFLTGQIVGIQFTPMFHQKPILAEGHIRYLMEEPEKGTLLIGLEFLGLEVSLEGRIVLKRLLETVSEYHRINQKSIF